MSVSASAISQLATVAIQTSPPEIYTARFVTSLTAPITSGLRPTVISVNDTLPVLGQGTFSIAIYDAGTDAAPVNYEALEVIGGGASNSWTVVTESGWSALAHATGSTVVVTVLTPRSIQQPLNNHITITSTPDPHPSYIKKQSFTAKGQLLAGTGNQQVFVPLPSGTDGQSLVSDSAQITGLGWRSLTLTSILQHMGDLIVGGVLGLVSKLGIGTVGQILTVVQNAVAITDPPFGPSCSAAVGSGMLTNGAQYDFAYAWQTGTTPDGGITRASPSTTFSATSSGIVTVQAPAAPGSGLTLVVYAALHNGILMLQGTLPNASTSSSNSVNVSQIAIGSVTQVINTTGGIAPSWQPLTAALNQIPVVIPNVRAAATTSLTATALPVIFGASGPAHGSGVVPDPGAVAGITHFLREDATWQSPTVVTALAAVATARLTAVAVPQPFGPSGPIHSVGSVPDPGAVAGNIRFLREDATFSVPVPAGTNNPRLSATASLSATAIQPGFGPSGPTHGPGSVPDPGAVAGISRFLREDATWQVAGTQISNQPRLSATASMIAAAPETPFGPSGAGHGLGDVPDPGVVAGSARFLREDASWQIPPGSGGSSGGGSVVPIQTQSPVGVNSITFSVPTGFKNLRISFQCRCDNAAMSADLRMQFNNDIGANYDWGRIGAGAGPSSAETYGDTALSIAQLPGASSTTGRAAAGYINIPAYADGMFSTQFHSTWSMNMADSSGNQIQGMYGGSWLNSAAVAGITLFVAGSGNFVLGSTFTLWGEADVAPVVTTSNTNLIQETVLAVAAASISVPTIPQGYREIRVELEGRGDTAATTVAVAIRLNGDTGANYDYAQTFQNTSGVGSVGQGQAATSALILNISAGTAPASVASGGTIVLRNYSATTFQKSFQGYGVNKSSNAAANQSVIEAVGFWRNTAAITSLLLFPSAGNFVAGTVVRVYGEPASVAGPSVGTGTRTRTTSIQLVPVALTTEVQWQSNDQDASNQHLLSPAPGSLAGTIAKTNNGQTITGTNTSFTTQLAVQQVVAIPSGSVVATASLVARAGMDPTQTLRNASASLSANAGMNSQSTWETFVVTAIASDTSATINRQALVTSSGGAGRTLNSAIVFPQAGMYEYSFGAYLSDMGGGTVSLQVILNDVTVIGQSDATALVGTAAYEVTDLRPFQQWDYIEAYITQTSGVPTPLLPDERTHFSVSGRPTVVAAVPYILIQDQELSGTQGGTFTSGAWQTRTLNTVVNDSASVSQLSLNQITLPPGTYRYEARAVGNQCDGHQLRFQDVTDSLTINVGDTVSSGSTDSSATLATCAGRFTITAQTVFQLQHRCVTTAVNTGFGSPNSWGTEVFATIELWKEG